MGFGFHISRKRHKALGIGLGVGLAGAVALAFRYGLRRTARVPFPDDHSPAIFARRLAATSFGDMVYHISGSGEPVVFLHGVYPGASSFEWSKVYPRFVMEREVIAVDLLGFGESERPEGRLDASDYAESLAEFLLQTCAGRMPLLVASGRSAGMALLLASRHPERVGALALAVPQIARGRVPWAGPGLVMASRIPPLGRFLYRFSIAREPFIRAWLSRFGYADPTLAGADVARNLAVCAQQEGAAHAILNTLGGRFTPDISSRLDRVPQRTTVMATEGDPAADFLMARLPNATCVGLPPCGELAPLEVCDSIADALGPLLGRPSAVQGAA